MRSKLRADMKIKILGVGKCGSRLCYDFFAQIRNLPSSYKIRALQNMPGYKKAARMVLEKTGFYNLSHSLRKEWEALVGAELLRDQAFYAIVDSDLDNNEVAGQLEFLAGDGEALLFPGKSYSLNGLTGGCQYHFISERIAHDWQSVPDDLLNPEGSEIFAFAFSTGGGTGGGAGVQLAAASCDRKNGKSGAHVIHRMGIAVLPSSDEPYYIKEHPRPEDHFTEIAPPPMDLVERYNTGRFFVSMLGRRTSGVNGTWLVSNDLMRAMVHDTGAGGSAEVGAAKTLDAEGLSLINGYISLALCTLCNASSRGTSSDSDLDARELNNHLNGLYISAFGHAKREPGASGESLVLHLQRLLERTFCGSKIVDGQLQGVSIPLQEMEVTALRFALMPPVTTFTEYRAKLSGQPSDNEPKEFRTAKRVVVLIGQPQGAINNIGCEEAVKTAVARIFFNSEPVFFSFRHAGDLDFLLAFIVDPFLPVVVNSMLDYIARTWISDTAKGSLLPRYVQSLEERQSIQDLMLNEDEIMHLPASPIGSATISSIGTSVVIPYGPDIVLAALDQLRAGLQWKKIISPRFS